jgi:hypothetical protein
LDVHNIRAVTHRTEASLKVVETKRIEALAAIDFSAAAVQDIVAASGQ